MRACKNISLYTSEHLLLVYVDSYICYFDKFDRNGIYSSTTTTTTTTTKEKSISLCICFRIFYFGIFKIIFCQDENF